MSTEITRATSKAAPLTLDDMAGLSLLYPTSTFASTHGSISGKVLTSAGAAVPLASVVAFTATGQAINTLTNPDGTYTLDGLPAGQYFVYAHPLPPSLSGETTPVNLELPSDPNGKITPNTLFDAVFYPGTSTAQQTVTVALGQTTSGTDFSVRSRTSVSLHSVQTYSFMGDVAIKPATFTTTAATGAVVFTGIGASRLLSGMSANLVSAPEAVVTGSLRPYSTGYLQFNVAPTSATVEGPRHLQLSYNNENYLLPAALRFTTHAAPSITAVTDNGDGTLSLAGTNLDSTTMVWLDGVAAKFKSIAVDGTLVYTLPPAPAGYSGVLAAFNADGQSSLFILADGSPSYSYSATSPVFMLGTTSMPAGAETVTEITSSGADLSTWTPQLAFGSSDVSAQAVYPVSSTRALARVQSASAATAGSTQLTALAGLATQSIAGGFQLTANARAPYFSLAGLTSASVYGGANVTLPVVNGPASAALATIQISIGGVPVTPVSYSGSAVTVQIPTTLATGAAIVRGSIGGVTLLPNVIDVGAAPPVIVSAQTNSGAAISARFPVYRTDLVILTVSGLASGVTSAQIKVASGTLQHPVFSVTPSTTQPGVWLVLMAVSPDSSGLATLPLTLTYGTATSAVFNLPFGG
jgi:hypothetical protein